MADDSNITVQKYVLMSLLEIFKDIIPGYVFCLVDLFLSAERKYLQ